MERRASPGTEGDARKPRVAIVVAQRFLYAAGLYPGEGWLPGDGSNGDSIFNDKQKYNGNVNKKLGDPGIIRNSCKEKSVIYTSPVLLKSISAAETYDDEDQGKM